MPLVLKESVRLPAAPGLNRAVSNLGIAQDSGDGCAETSGGNRGRMVEKKGSQKEIDHAKSNKFSRKKGKNGPVGRIVANLVLRQQQLC